MSESLGIGVVIGATLSKAYHNVFDKASKNAIKLGDAYEQANSKLASAKAVNHYKTQLDKLKAKQASLGTSSKRLNAGIANLEARYKKAKIEAKSYGLSIGNIVQEQSKLQKSSDRLALKTLAAQKRDAGKHRRGELHGQMLGAVGTAWALSQPLQQAIEFESVMADVKKVIDFESPDQFKAMGKDVLNLSTRIPMAASGIGNIVAAAGQAGIARHELLQFAEDAAKMGVAFDMSGAEAGAAMTGLRSIFKLGQTEVVQLGDAFNHLANNMDTTAADLLQISNRAGSTADLFGLSGQQLGALGATFKALKTPTEVAGTAINAMLLKLATADKQGAKFDEALQGVGLSAADMKDAIADDAQGALIAFLEAAKGSEDVLGTLSDMFGAEYSDDVSKLVNGLDQYKKAINLTSDASKYQNSMLKEYEARSKTTANALQLFKNQTTKLGVTLGSVLLPPINWMVGNLGIIANGIAYIADKFPLLTNVIVGATAGIVGFKIVAISASYAGSFLAGSLTSIKAVMMGLTLATKASTYQLGLQKAIAAGLAAKQVVLGGAMVTSTAAQWAWNIALNANPLGLLVAGIAAVVGGAYLLYKNWDTVIEWFNKALGGIGAVFSWIGDTWNSMFGDDDTKQVKIKPVVEGIGKIATPAVTAATAATVGTAAAMTPATNLPISDHINSPTNQSQAISAPAGGGNQYHITINTNGNANAQDIAGLVRQEIERIERDHAAKARGALYD